MPRAWRFYSVDGQCWSRWAQFHTYLSSLMTAEPSVQEREWQQAAAAGNSSAYFHIMRVKRLAKAWGSANCSVVLKGLVGPQGQTIEDPDTCALMLTEHWGRVFSAGHGCPVPGEGFLQRCHSPPR
eukprot:3243528-Pyramimonas_sp.AAC.1